MDVIDYELKRYEQMKNDLEVRRNPEANKLKDQTLNKSHEGLFDTIMNEEKPREMEPPRRRIPELKQRPKSGNWSSYHGGIMSSSLTKAHSMNNSYHENLAKETANGSTETLQSNNDSIDEKLDEPKTDPRKQKDEYDKQNKQLKLFAKKQEQLLRVAFYLLLNIAENVKLEEKMRRKNIISMLVKAVERQNIDLLVLIVTFLKKLSIVRDNKDEMHDLMIVDKLPMLLHSSHPDLIQVTLKLLYNLSFDGKLRARMVRVGILPKLVTFLSDDKHHGIVTKILYHLSLDDKVKSMFFYTDCIPIVTDMLLLNLNQKSELDLVGLGINLALNKGNAQLMVENNRLHSMMARAFKFQDALLMKMIRNIAQHEPLRPHFIVSFQ
jgi:Kinesin-associated protein (KAP)